MSCSVYLLNRKCGTLDDSDGFLSFEYDSEYLESKEAVQLSQSLPLKSGKFDSKDCFGFFEGLLPEGERRSLLAMSLHVSRDNVLELLRHIGRDCAGAVQILDKEKIPDENKFMAFSDPLEEEALLDLLTKFQFEGQDYRRISLAGAQNKCALSVEKSKSGMVYRYPKFGTPSTHIVKVGREAFPDLVDNEAYCLALAYNMGLTTIFPMIDLQFSEKLLVVERYDRNEEHGRLTRIHQEDFCQALGLPSIYKYHATTNGPGPKELFSVARSASQQAKAALTMLKYIVFHILIGDDDGHAKNYSLLYQNGKTVLAPLYDLVSTRMYGDIDRILQPMIGGQSRIEFLESIHLSRFFEEIGMKANGARKIILNFIEEFESVAFENHIRVENMNEAIIENLHRIFKTQIGFLLDAVK